MNPVETESKTEEGSQYKRFTGQITTTCNEPSVLLGNPGKQKSSQPGAEEAAYYPLDLLLRLRAYTRGISSGISVWPGAMHAPSARQRRPQVVSTGVAPSLGEQTGG